MFYFKKDISNNILYGFNQTKSTISDYISTIQTNIKIYFNQAEQLKNYINENQKLKNYIAQLAPMISNYENFKEFQLLNSTKVEFAKTISYAKLPDLTSIYITYNEKNLITPRGLIYNNQAAGIVIKSIKNFSLAYLNNNSNTSYTVFIGKDKIPGILFGGDIIKIKFIPKYHKIKKGDLVITSGLDKIFYQGVKVGIVKSIKETSLYQEAIITPFYNPLNPTFFYVVRK